MTTLHSSRALVDFLIKNYNNSWKYVPGTDRKQLTFTEPRDKVEREFEKYCKDLLRSEMYSPL